MPNFGDHIADENPLKAVMEKAVAIKNSSDLQLALRDVYETTYGVHNHTGETEQDALSLVGLRDVEDSTSGGLLYERFRQYDERDVGKYFKIDVLEFLDLPTDLVTFILEYCLRKQEKQSKVARDVEDEIKRAAGEQDD